MGRSIAVRHSPLSNGAEGVSYSGDPVACDSCGRPLAGERFFTDAALTARGHAWGILCEVCTLVDGVRPGWGRAQLYERVDSAGGSRESGTHHWRCVVGGPPRGLTEA
mgnify:CR=1 FL=1